MPKLQDILKDQPSYRIKQIEKAWFDVNINGYNEITTLPLELREKLADFPWVNVELHTLLTSKLDNTRKLLFKLHDNNYIEMVIMGRRNLKGKDALNYTATMAEEDDDEASPLERGVAPQGRGVSRPLIDNNKDSNTSRPDANRDTFLSRREFDGDRYTICISSQAGCPMRCAFCATGRGGLKRNLTAEEIIDQVRFAQRLLAKEGARVNNIVLMGQGEPMLNYDNVKRALNLILEHTDIGETKITLSTAGVVPMMQKAIEDPDFPPVRWAISLHSAVPESRLRIMPSHRRDFLDFLVKWTADYHKRFPGRTRFIGLEYIMLGGVNDDEKHLRALIKLAKKMPLVRINLIPYNVIDADSDQSEKATKYAEEHRVTPPPHQGGDRGGLPSSADNFTFSRTPPEHIEYWHDEIMKAGFTSTIRYSQGQDIMAACGQLQNTVK